MKHELAFIGGGQMATALAAGALASGLFEESALVFAEPLAAQRDKLAERFAKARLVASAAEALPLAKRIVLSVKPQVLPAVCQSLREADASRHLVISIAAGFSLASLQSLLGTERIVRVMPNTPALVQAGVSALYAMPGVADEDRDRAETILAAVGPTLWVQREELMDAVTAVSGSGPAYVFYFMEALMDAAHELGLNAADARLLALETFHGAAALARQSVDPPATLRARVTSKGGTTEAALRALEEQAVRERIVAAVKQAAARSRELGEELGRAE
jgi:pyrroline-5-carboxylate reductase